MRSRLLGDLARIALVAVAYYAAGRASVTLSVVDVAPVSPVWPPRGLALAFLLLLGYRVWPGVAAGALLAAASSGVPLLTSAGVAAGSTLDVLLGTYLLRRYGFRPSLERVRDVLLLLTLAALLSTTVSATVGVGSVLLGGVAPVASAGRLWVTWWTSDAMGDVLVAPVLLAWAARPRRRVPPSRLGEAAVLLTLSILVSRAAFGDRLSPGQYAFAYLTIPLVVWAALRFGQRGAATTSLVVLGLAAWSTAGGTGPFARAPASESLLQLQLFMSVAAVTGLVLAAVLAERDEAMEALVRAETKFHGMFDQAVGGVFQSTPDGRVITANPALARMLGYDSPEEVMASLTDVRRQLYVDPAQRSEFTRVLAEHRSVQGFPAQVYRRDGTAIWVTVSAREVRDPGGALLYYEGTAEDITERKQAEEELAGQRAFLRQVIDINPHHIFAKDREGRFLLVNQTVADAYGTTVAGLSGKTDADFASAEEAAAFRRDDLEVMNSGREKIIPVEPLTDVQGRLHWLQTIKRPMEYRDGAYQQVLGVATDMTDRVHAEEALRSSEERYRALYDDTPSMYFTVDADGIVLSVNRFGAAELGYTPDELVGGSVLRVFLEDDRSSAVAHVAECVAHPGQVFQWELRKVRRNGDLVWVKETARAVHDRAGRLVVLIVCEDITKRKRAEERQAELQASLRRSETMSAMGLLVAGVAHEVRNPLFAISASLDAFEARMRTGTEHARTIAVLRAEIGRLNLLMQELLDYGKPAQSAPVPESVAAIVAEAEEWCAGLAGRVEVGVLTYVEPGLPPILMDRKRLVQVFQNLLQNGIQHSPPGGVVNVTATLEDDGDRCWIEIVVSDSGPGFPPEDLPRVFEPFFTKRRGGTGLGLAIVQRIVEDHGGTVGAANRPGGGGAVIVRLPCAGPREKRAPKPDRVAAGPAS